MSNINFDNPYLLFLAIPIAALFIIPFAIAVRKDNLNGHNIASGIIHILMALIIAFVAAGTTIVTTVTETDVYVVADVSYSANKNLDTIDRYISDLGKSLPRNSKMGVVTFAKQYQLLTPLGERPQSVKESKVDKTATDIISALRYTGDLFREDVIKRIVLITDGKQTSETDANALKRQVDALVERNIHVDAIYIDDNIDLEKTREVQLSSVQVTPTTFLNVESKARITVNVSCPASRTVEGADGEQETVPFEVNTLIDVKRTRRSDGAEDIQENIPKSFTRGSNSYDLQTYTAEAGVYDYEVTIKTAEEAEDENPLNNVISFTQEVAGKQKVLVIYSEQNDYDVIARAYGNSADVVPGYYLDTSDATGIKPTVEWINQFDEIVISNVDVSEMKNSGSFVSSLDTAVKMFGKSLITIGDTNIQNNTRGENEQLKALSDMLPVRFGKSEGAAKLYTLLIDTSRSMEMQGRLTRAKDAARSIVGMLEENDTVALVQFNGTPASVISSKLADGGREMILREIDNLEVRQGTDIPAALEYVIPSASGGEFAERKLMVISDGMNFSFDEGDVQTVRESVLQLRNRGVVTSALDVGRSGVSASVERDAVQMLENDISKNGGGAYLLIDSDANYDEVLNSKLPEDVNSSEGSTSEIRVNRRYDDVLTDIDTRRLTGGNSVANKFFYSTARGEATTVLTVDFETVSLVDTGSGQTAVTSMVQVPLYAYKEYGNGRTASFTAGFTSEWLIMNAQLREQLLQNILGTNVPEQKISEPFTVDIEVFNGYAEVTLTPERPQDSYEAVTSIEITFTDGEKTTTTVPVSLAATQDGLTHTVITGDVGSYTIKITYQAEDDERVPVYTLERTLHVAYPSEYDSFALYDAGTLHKMVGAQGTVSENGSLTIVNDENEVGLYNVSLNMPLLITCVVLYAVDIAVRKLKWEDIKSLFKRHKKVK